MSAFATKAELRAENAENLSAFTGLKLLHVRNGVIDLLSLIGREKLFSEYTKHDISHVDAMLEMTDWIIPSETADQMTPADWLMLVLSIYLHDLGMVVTRQEWENRPKAQISQFLTDKLFSGDDGQDYKARIDVLGTEERDRFVFEEFIRETHGQRVRRWLESPPDSGSENQIHKEVHELVESLPSSFRADLGLICESHHLEDLGNIDKYQLDKPYGLSDEESVNLQYAAAILRSTDLLHITSDRTPPILFRVINPTDPVSQGEWAKQRAVRNVRAQPRRDDEGNLREGIEPDTIEVFADFDDPEAFFGLTSYLVYAQQQLQRTQQWIAASERKTPRPYEFPWRNIDDSAIETRGYLPRPYEFAIDQQRVLTLLTGHTLYNRANVVVRELIQNSLDAVRLQRESELAGWEGRVDVLFDSEAGALHVSDNGTGMTQRMIEEHLLRVGASRYQDAEFKKAHPSFSAISRFGIGVLSAFMIADRVVITTVHESDPDPRQLTLRSVHGKYLIRVLDGEKDSDAEEVLPHGTKVSLWLRPSARLDDLLDVVRLWIVVPRCRVCVSIDGEPPVEIGFSNVEQALSAWLDASGYSVKPGELEIRTAESGGIQLAWAVRWSQFFRSWSMVTMSSRRDQQQVAEQLGLCVEGIRVEGGSPGFGSGTIAAIANAVGARAPKTNVARSGLEDTPELRSSLGAIYRSLCDEVSNEVDRMVKERDLSITWAADEARWLLSPLQAGVPRNVKLFEDAVKTVPALLVEDEGHRRTISGGELEALDEFWTIESNTFASAEKMLRELGASVSISSLREAFKSHDLDLPTGPVVTGYWATNLVTGLAFAGKEVSEFVIRADQRRVDLRWRPAEAGPGRWRALRSMLSTLRRDLFEGYASRGAEKPVVLARSHLPVVGGEGETAIEAFSRLFVLPDVPVARTANAIIDQIEADGLTAEGEVAIAFLEMALRDLAPLVARNPARGEQLLERRMAGSGGQVGRVPLEDAVSQYVKVDELATAFGESEWKVFDPSQWLRSEDSDMLLF